MRRISPVAHLIALFLFFMGGIVCPFFGKPAKVVLLLLLATLYASAWLRRSVWLDQLAEGVRGHPGRQKALLLVGSVVVTLGGLEYLSHVLVQTGFVKSYSPLEVQLPPGTADWRIAHMTYDEYWVPDPVLLCVNDQIAVV